MTDQTENTTETENETTEEQTSAEASTEKTFSQAELDKILADRLSRERAKFEGFDDYKTRAESADALKEQNTELLTRVEAAELKAVRLEVSQETGVPVSALTATDEESMRKQAEDLKAWRGESVGVKRQADTSGNSSGPVPDAKQRAAEALRRL